MTKELIVREANGADSSRVIEFLNKVGTESNFLTIDEVGILISEAEMTDFLNQQAEKDNNAYFLAFVGDEIAGILHLTADYHYRVPSYCGTFYRCVRRLSRLWHWDDSTRRCT